MQNGIRCAAFLGLALTVGVGLPAPAADAESGVAYGSRRAVDATGRWSVVLEGADDGMQFTFAEAPAGSPPVVPLEAGALPGEGGTDVSVREGDTVLATGLFKEAVEAVRISSRGLGFAAIAGSARGESGPAFAWVGRDGAVRHEKRMEDLFPREKPSGLGRPSSGSRWFRDAWVDDDAREVVVVGAGPRLSAVSVDTGAVRSAGAAEIRRALSHPDPAARATAVDLALELKLGCVTDAIPPLLCDPAAAVRVRVAAALAQRGDERGRRLLLSLAKTPRAEGVGEADHDLAIERLAPALGSDAIPLLAAAMGSGSVRAWGSAANGFAALGERAVPSLLAMLSEPGRASDTRGGSAYALGRIGSRAALPALLVRIADRDDYVASGAASAAIAIGQSSILKDLAALLDTPTTQDGRLASYFEEVKEPASVGPLVRCLARHARAGYPRAVIAKALAFQTGADLGDDAAAWAAWLAKHSR